MKTVAIIQAQFSAIRLPGKVLLPLGNKSVLRRVIERVRHCRALHDVVIASSIAPEDDPVVAEVEQDQVTCFRGSVTDVLGRYFGAAEMCQADVVVRVSADCPLIDPQLICQMVDAFQARNLTGQSTDYMSNTLKRTYPHGLEAEIFTYAALRQAYERADQAFEREHVTPFIYRHPDIFNLFSYEGRIDQSSYRLGLESAEDYQLLEAIYGELGQESGLFSTQAVINLLIHQPKLARLNAPAARPSTHSGYVERSGPPDTTGHGNHRPGTFEI